MSIFKIYKWRVIKICFSFFNEFVFLGQSETGLDVNVDDLRKYILNGFHETIPSCRNLTTLSFLDDVILKLHDKNLEGIQDDMYNVRENVMYKISFEKFVDDNDDDNDD